MINGNTMRLRHALEAYMPLNDDVWATIEKHFTPTHITRGEYFLTAGDVCNSIAFVVSGFLRNSTLNEAGQEITTHFSGAKSFALSFYSFRNKAPSFESIVATEDTVILEVSRTALEYLMANVPAWKDLYLKIVEEAYACMEQRIFIIQNYSAQQKYTLLIEEADPMIQQKAQLGHIASYLGISSETLSRVRKKISKTPF